MATVALLFPVTQVAIDAVVFDATLSESHQNETEVTEHPVEQGANIVDHKRPKPRIVTIEGVISNTPLGGTPDPSRVRQAYDQLLALKNSAALITVVTSVEAYENMTVQSVQATRDPRSGQAMRVAVTCKEIKQVTLQVANVEKKSAGRVNLGKKATTATVADKTIGAQLLDNAKQGAKSLLSSLHLGGS